MIYAPDEDSFLLVEEVRRYAKNKICLDMCSGTGIQSEAALSVNAKSVLAADIDKESVNLLKKKGIPAIHSDVFSNIMGKFDVIICNPPYLPKDKLEDEESSLSTTGGKLGDEFIIRLIKQSAGHLMPKGIILVVMSSLTPKKRIISIIKKDKMSYKIIAHKKIFMESLEVWKINKNI